MIRLYYLQRLLKPIAAWRSSGEIPGVCVLDMMWNATFEFGAVQKALNTIHHFINEYSCNICRIPFECESVMVHIFCKTGESKMIAEFLRKKCLFDTDRYDPLAPTGEKVLFREAITRQLPNLAGWLEVDSICEYQFCDFRPCLFCIDKEMFEKLLAYVADGWMMKKA